MDFFELIFGGLDDWICEKLIGVITFISSYLFVFVDATIGNAHRVLRQSPSDWNPTIYTFIENVSTTVILPICGIILTFVMCNELIHMIIDKNNMHDFPISDIGKWIFKTCISIYLVTNVFTICMAIFDVSQTLVTNSIYVIGDTSINIDSVMDTFETNLATMAFASLLTYAIIVIILCLLMLGIYFYITILLNCRMIEIYLMVAVAPIPFSTFGNKEWSSIGQNFLKSLLALGLQAFLMVLCIGIYSVLIDSMVLSSDPLNALLETVSFTLLLAFTLGKTNSIAKSILNAH